jgi:hypothetical protein
MLLKRGCKTPMTKVRASDTVIYNRRREPTGKTHVSDGDLRGIITPTYRGWKLACLAGEIEAVKRRIDACWADRYLAADTPAGRVSVLMEERAMRYEPKEWTGP